MQANLSRFSMRILDRSNNDRGIIFQGQLMQRARRSTHALRHFLNLAVHCVNAPTLRHHGIAQKVRDVADRASRASNAPTSEGHAGGDGSDGGGEDGDGDSDRRTSKRKNRPSKSRITTSKRPSTSSSRAVAKIPPPPNHPSPPYGQGILFLIAKLAFILLLLLLDERTIASIALPMVLVPGSRPPPSK